MGRTAVLCLVRLTSVTIVGWSLATAWSSDNRSNATPATASEFVAGGTDPGAERHAFMRREMFRAQDELPELLLAIEDQLAALDPEQAPPPPPSAPATPTTPVAPATSPPTASPTSSPSSSPIAEGLQDASPTGTTAARPSATPSASPSASGVASQMANAVAPTTPDPKATKKTLEAMLRLSHAADRGVVQIAIAELGALANSDGDTTEAADVRKAALERLLEISRCGNLETRETYAAVNAIYGARRKTGPLLAERLTPLSPFYIAQGRLQISGRVCCTPSDEILFEDEIVSAGLLQVMVDGSVSETKVLLVKNAAELVNILRLLAAAKRAETHSRFVRDGAVAGLARFQNVNKFDDSLIVGIADELTRQHQGPDGTIGRLEPHVAVELLRVLAKQKGIAPSEQVKLAERYAKITTHYFDDRGVLGALGPAVVVLHEQMHVAVEPRPTATRPTASAPTFLGDRNRQFFVTTDVDSAVVDPTGRLSNAADPKNGAAFGPRLRLDPLMQRARGTIPQDQRPGLRATSSATGFSLLGDPTGSGGARGARGVSVGAPTAPPASGS